MREEFDVLTGYSDHTQSDISSIAAIALGAVIIEKHFSLDKSLPGPDQSSSVDVEELTTLVRNIRLTESALGSANKIPSESELQNKVGMRRSLVPSMDVRKGQMITEKMIATKRPATGLAPSRLPNILGKIAEVDLVEDQEISEGMFR
jgi:N-acetylneuraminate synthase/N,N'-diacetyllegionaminate synthase